MIGKQAIGEPRLLHSYPANQRAGELAFHPGTYRLYAAYGNTVTAYEEKGPQEIWDAASFRKHLVAGADGTLYLDHVAWHPGGKRKTPDLVEGRGYELESARYTTTGDFIAANIRWRPPRGRPVRGPEGEKSYEYSRPNKPDGPKAFFRVVRAADGEETLRADGTHYGLASSADHFAVAVAPTADGSKVVLIEAATGKVRALERDSDEPPTNGPISFSPDGQALAVVTWEGLLTRWEAPDFEQPSSMALKAGDATVKSMAVHPQGTVFVGLSDGRMMFVDPDSGQVLREWSAPDQADVDDFDREISAAAISDDGELLATAHGATGAGVRIWKLSGR